MKQARRRGLDRSEGPSRELHDGAAFRPSEASSGSRELAALLVAGFPFGLAMAAIKGAACGGARHGGKHGAPWALLPFLAGTRYTRILYAAWAGIGITLAAFFGFYLAEAAILDLSPLPWYTDLRLTLGFGHAYEVWGIASGCLYGTLGGLWRARSLVAVQIVLGLAFICEPLAVWAVARMGLWGGGGLLDYPWLWITEVTIGFTITCIVFGTARTRLGPGR